MLIDWFMCNGDRNWSNINFIYSKDSKTLKLTPLFDNGECFYMQRMVSKNHKDDELFLHLGSMAKLDNNKLSNNECIAQQIYSLCKQNRKLNDLLDKCLTVNIFDMIDKVEKVEDFKFTKQQKDTIIQTYTEQIVNFKKVNLETNQYTDKSSFCRQ